jgi:hypothetical protein
MRTHTATRQAVVNAAGARTAATHQRAQYSHMDKVSRQVPRADQRTVARTASTTVERRHSHNAVSQQHQQGDHHSAVKPGRGTVRWTNKVPPRVRTLALHTVIVAGSSGSGEGTYPPPSHGRSGVTLRHIEREGLQYAGPPSPHPRSSKSPPQHAGVFT